MYLLWNKETINESIKDIEDKLKIKIINYINWVRLVPCKLLFFLGLSQQLFILN
jgi:hypothetical protein